MKYTFLAAALIALPSLAAAQSQLDRLEAASEQMSHDMFALMVNEMAANGADPEPIMAVIPDMTWDDEMRVAGQCMLDAYTALIGPSGMDDMLDNMDAMRRDFADLVAAGGTVEDMPDTDGMMPEGLSIEASAQITQDCGMLDIQMRRMTESGFSSAMMEAMQ